MAKKLEHELEQAENYDDKQDGFGHYGMGVHSHQKRAWLYAMMRDSGLCWSLYKREWLHSYERKHGRILPDNYHDWRCKTAMHCLDFTKSKETHITLPQPRKFRYRQTLSALPFTEDASLKDWKRFTRESGWKAPDDWKQAICGWQQSKNEQHILNELATQPYADVF